MLAALDTGRRWLWELPGQEDVPAPQRVRAVCRLLSFRQFLAYRERRAAALDQSATDPQVAAALIDAAAAIVVHLENTPPGVPTTPDGLLDLATPLELARWTVELGTAVQLAGVDAGKSGPPPHGGGGESAQPAGTVASA